MSPMQATKANALVGEGKRPESVLSPRQMIILQHVRKDKKNGSSAIHIENWEDAYYKRWQELEKASL